MCRSKVDCKAVPAASLVLQEKITHVDLWLNSNDFAFDPQVSVVLGECVCVHVFKHVFEWE